MIDKRTIERIKETARIEDVVDDFRENLKLRKQGKRYAGFCPFHDDRHGGNFFVYPPKNAYKCFACGAKGGPIDFVMNYLNLKFDDALRYLGKKYGMDVDMKEIGYTPPPPRPAPPPLPMLELPMWMVKQSEQIDNSELVGWLRGHRWDHCQRQRLEQALKDYHVGYSKQGMTIYWQIDERGHVRTGKMMKYKADGHRDKESRYNFDFAHSRLYKDARWPQYDDDKVEVKQCLYGLHLLTEYEQIGVAQTVNLVESEKTALVMAAAYGNNAKSIWMATGGLEHLTREKLKPLIDRHRYIVCWPDRDGIEKWKMRVESLKYDRISVDDKPVTQWWKPEDGAKADIADVVLRMIDTKRIYKTAEEVVEDMPQLKALHEKLQFELVDGRESEK